MPVGISICKTCSKEYKWKRTGKNKHQVPNFCSLECRKFKNWSKEQKLERLKKSYEKDVIRKDGCWDWKGTKHEDGYAKLSISFRIGIQSGHGASYIIHKGEIPEGMQIRHKCNNPICTNPDHLEIGTSYDNGQDKVKSGRSARGSRNAHAKLDEKQVIEIKKMFKTEPSNAKIAKLYNVDCSTIFCIRINKTWKHISP